MPTQYVMELRSFNAYSVINFFFCVFFFLYLSLQSSIKNASYGNDLPQVQAAMAQSKADLQAVLDFAVNIDKCRTVLVSKSCLVGVFMIHK